MPAAARAALALETAGVAAQVVAVVVRWVLALHTMRTLPLPTDYHISDDLVNALGRLLMPAKVISPFPSPSSRR